MSILKFVKEVLSNRNNKAKKYSLGRLKEKEISMLKEKTGLNLEGYKRVIDKFGVIHAFKNHGNEELEKKRGQKAIKPSDFQLIPEVTETPDKIDSGVKNSHGKDLIKNTKKIDDTIIYVEEKRDGKKVLATQTLYKR